MNLKNTSTKSKTFLKSLKGVKMTDHGNFTMDSFIKTPEPAKDYVHAQKKIHSKSINTFLTKSREKLNLEIGHNDDTVSLHYYTIKPDRTFCYIELSANPRTPISLSTEEHGHTFVFEDELYFRLIKAKVADDLKVVRVRD